MSELFILMNWDKLPDWFFITYPMGILLSITIIIYLAD